MKQLIFLYLFSFLSSNTFSQNHFLNGYKCFIKVNLQDCQNCYTSLDYLKLINNNIPVFYVFKDSYKEQADELKLQYVLDTNRQVILFSDSLYYNISDLTVASVTITDNSGKIIKSFALRNIGMYIDFINFQDSTYIKTLPPNFDVIVKEGVLLLLNPQQNEITIYPTNSLDKKGSTIKFNKQLIKECNLSYFKDSIEYNQKEALLKSMKIPPFMQLNKIISMDIKNGYIYFIVESLYPKLCFYNGKNDTCFVNFYTLVKCANGNFTTMHIKNTYPNPVDIFTYKDYSTNCAQLHVVDSGLFLSIAREVKGFKNSYIGYWQLSNNQYQYVKELPINLSNLIYTFKVGYSLTDYIIHFPYLMQRFSNEIIDLRDFSVTKLKIVSVNKYLIDESKTAIEPTKVLFSIADFFNYGDTLTVIYSINNKYKVSRFANFSKKPYTTYNMLEEEFNGVKLRSKPFLIDPNYVVLFPETSNYMLKKRLKNY